MFNLSLEEPREFCPIDLKEENYGLDNLPGGGFIFFIFTPKIGEMIQFDEHIFSNGLKPPTRFNMDIQKYYPPVN